MKTTALAEAYYEKAESDMADAERALRDGSYPTCVFFCQQTAEKGLKSILALEGIETRTHHVGSIARQNLGRFRKLEETVLNKLLQLIDVSETLEPHVARTRYPWREGTEIMRPDEFYTKETAEKAAEDAKKGLAITREILNYYKNRTSSAP